jgi:hypothetical protein
MTDENKPKRGRPPKVKVDAPRRRTIFWDATTHKEYERLMRAYLVALNVSQAGQDHIADVAKVDEAAEVVIAKINKHRGIK